MSAPFEDLAGLDKVIHEPSRLAITTALEACEAADFLYLQRLTGLSKGNLSAHLTKLEEAGVVRIEKGFTGKKPYTRAALTAEGRHAVTGYWTRMEQLRQRAREWEPEDR